MIEENNKLKVITFSLIVLTVLVATVYVAGSTIYLNVVSQTKGPVHWHADFEIWNCEEKIKLVDPKGLANRLGNTVLHVHGDDAIHVEGIVVDEADVSLHSVFSVIGGELKQDLLSVPTNEGMVEMRKGDMCNGKEGKLQAFVYKIKNPQQNKNWIYEQVKLEDIGKYVLSPYQVTPPGDCIIIEFDQDKISTNKICELHRLAVERGELSGS